ncbi:MAG: AI-2E family transporter [Alphaproteobacteria bacterium]|nr:AI-2E family transporter [Alphaproteobacteria bacterium]
MTTRQQAVAWIVGFAVFIALVVVLGNTLLPFVTGMAIAYFLDPACDKLEAMGCSRAVATSLITFFFFALLVAVLMLLVPLISAQLIHFADRVPGYFAALREKSMFLMGLIESRLAEEQLRQLEDVFASASKQALTFAGKFTNQLLSGIGSLISLLSLAVITPIVTFYLLRDWDRIIEKIDGWLPRDRIELIREQTRLIDETLAGFARGQALVCLMLGVFYAVGLSIVGLEFGMVVGFVTGLISFVPYFGMLFGFVAGIGIAIAQFGEIGPILMVAAVFGAGQVLEGNFLTPKLVGDRVGLHAVWIIFALLAGGSLFGFLGIMLAVPIMAVIGVLARFLLGQYLASPMYLAKGAPPSGPSKPRDGGV